MNPASQTPSTQGNSMRENRKTPLLPAAEPVMGRREKAMSYKSLHGSGSRAAASYRRSARTRLGELGRTQGWATQVHSSAEGAQRSRWAATARKYGSCSERRFARR